MILAHAEQPALLGIVTCVIVANVAFACIRRQNVSNNCFLYKLILTACSSYM